MPRFYFDIADGTIIIDESGITLDSITEVRAHAIQTAGLMLRDAGQDRWDGDEWRMSVRDAAHQVVLRLRFSAESMFEVGASSTGVVGAGRAVSADEAEMLSSFRRIRDVEIRDVLKALVARVADEEPSSMPRFS